MLILSSINILINALIALVVYKLSRKSIIIEDQYVKYDVRRIKRYGRGRLVNQYVYLVFIDFKDKIYSQVINAHDYKRLDFNWGSNKRLRVHCREFKNRLFSPDFQKYQFSLHEINWELYDRKRCLTMLIYSSIFFELMAICIYFGV